MLDSIQQKKIEGLLKANSVLIFMKGNKEQPQCGFSALAIAILKRLGTDFETYDILQDAQMRQDIKEYSNWPTLPQVYINGKFIGGSDILQELYEKGELQKLVEQQSH
jgi:monothiol glutaredoxin